MRFLVDAQLPPGLAGFLQTLGFEAVACRDLGLRDAEDDMIWRFALGGGWCIVTKDEDFAVRHLTEAGGPEVVWLRIGNCTNAVLFSWLESLWPRIVRELESGQRLIEVAERAT